MKYTFTFKSICWVVFAITTQAVIAATPTNDFKFYDGAPIHGQILVGDPINVGTRNMHFGYTLYEGPGPNPVRFAVFYNSNYKEWRWNYGAGSIRLYKTIISGGNGSIVYIRMTRPNGTALNFRNFTYGSNKRIWTGDVSVKGTKVTENLDSNYITTSYTYLDKDGNTETYTASQGLLVSIADRNGNTLTFARDANGNVSSVTDAGGRVYTVNANTSTGSITFTTPNGRVYQINQNLSNRQYSSLVFPDNNTIQFNYDAETGMKLLGVTDELGNQISSWTWGTNVISSTVAGKGQVTTSYDLSNGNASATRQDGSASSYSFKIIRGINQFSTATIAGVTTQNTYDSNANVTTSTDGNGHVTTYSYTSDGRNLETSRLLASDTKGTGNDISKLINTTWHSTWYRPTVIKEYTDGTNTTLARQTTFTYDAKGNLLTRAVTVGSTTRTWTYTYNTAGQVLTAKDPLNRTTTYAYGTTGNDKGLLVSVTNALTQATTIAHTPEGWVSSMTDPNGVVTAFTYDARGRITSKAVGGIATTTYGYDAAGQLTTLTQPGSVVLAYAYDAGHRLTQISDAAGNKVLYGYDAMGRVNSVQNKDAGGNLTLSHAYAYDGLGRLIQSTGAGNQTTAYTYDNNGNPISVTDPLNQITTRQFDALNRLTKAVDPAHQVDQVSTTYGYDSFSELGSVTDPRGLVTQYNNNGFGAVTTQTSPDTGATAFTYDAAGNVLTRTDAKGQVTSYTYDALNRVTGITYQGGATSSFTYDAGTNGKGRLTGMTDATGTYAYSWNTLGNLVSETRTLSGVAYTTGYGYDASGRQNRITYPSGRIINYTRDSQGRINGVTSTVGGVTQTLASNVQYQPFGGLKSLAFGNGGTYTRTYDQDSRITSYSLGTGARSLGYDTDSRINASADYAAAAPTVPTNVQNYAYDTLDRLTGWTAPGTNQGYAYDNNGNRTSLTIGANTYGYTYPAASNRLQATQGPAPARAYVYDANGSPTADGTNTYSYDARGRLTQAVTLAGTAGYGVNSYGQRVKKTLGGTTTLYHYDRDGHVIAESDATGAAVAEYVYLGDMPLTVFR